MKKTVNGITLLKMIKNGEIEKNILIEVVGGTHSHYPYVIFGLTKKLCWAHAKNNVQREVFSNELLEYSFVIKEDILDAKEKEYLSNVIKPFRNRVKYIKKCNLTSEYISIWYEDIINGSDNFSLPYFKKGTMYKNMELCKAYSLEELGL